MEEFTHRRAFMVAGSAGIVDVNVDASDDSEELYLFFFLTQQYQSWKGILSRDTWLLLNPFPEAHRWSQSLDSPGPSTKITNYVRVIMASDRLVHI